MPGSIDGLEQRGASRPSLPAGQSPSGSTPRSLTLGRTLRARRNRIFSYDGGLADGGFARSQFQRGDAPGIGWSAGT